MLKGYSGFYYVEYNNQIYECSLRGKNKLINSKFLPGDQVIFSIISDFKGVIEKVLPRKNELTRPPIANVDQVIIVNACLNPPPDFWMIDRLTILALWNKTKPILCFNKSDLVTEDELNRIRSIYEKANFKVIFTSSKQNIGIDELKETLTGKKSVFAGLSGVGKSSLLNSLQTELKLQTGEISNKLKRGKHTTRHVEFLPFTFGGLVADTPGFSSLDLPKDIVREQFSWLFPEIYAYQNECKFSTCLHNKEPKCAVKEAVSLGKISENRYKNYLAFLEEVISNERSY
ncbi:ribosome small subunit-dependent GTPase A [Desulfonispora thiosulfatigenes]|uniref:ribosome small subunit-dependent GTPase A n=1 Tax=Desulfonispora thiosulfatigenes TaxID=83661 RepID=UPI003119F631